MPDQAADSSTSDLVIGRDVPWVTSWSGEAQSGVSRCPSVDGQLAIGQAEKPGAGEPLYARSHLFRQRRTVREMLCPMCGKPTPEDDRWSQTAQMVDAGQLRARGFGAALPREMEGSQALMDCGTLAPLHRACAENSHSRCPHIGGLADQNLAAFPRGWIIVPLWVEARPPGVSASSVPVVSFLQLLGVMDA